MHEVQFVALIEHVRQLPWHPTQVLVFILLYNPTVLQLVIHFSVVEQRYNPTAQERHVVVVV